MWRPVAVGLFAVNLLFFVWVVMIAPPADPSARARGSPPEAPPGAAAAPVQPAAVPPPRCVSLGPFADAALSATVAQRLVAAGLQPGAREETLQQRDGYWVVIETSGTAQQRAVLTQIRRAGVQDAYAMPDDPQFRVSLGIYSDRARAEQRAATLRPLDLAARVEEHLQPRVVHWLDVPRAGDRLSASRLETFGITDSEVGAFDCPAPAGP